MLPVPSRGVGWAAPVLRWFLSVITEPEALGGLCTAAGSARLASLVALKCQAGTARWASSSIMHVVGRPPAGSWQSTGGQSYQLLLEPIPATIALGRHPPR